jgi:polar amino acid transport system substrate-binding protein
MISHKHQRVLLILGVTLFSLNCMSPTYAKDSLVLNTTISPPLSNIEGTGITDLQLYEVFRRTDIDLKIEHLPAERALKNANEGIDDGTFLRVSRLSASYPNLVEVPESFMDFEFVAISKNPKIDINGWESLVPYNIGLITGWKIVENNTRNMKVTKVSNVDQLFQLLRLDRAEIVIYEKIRALSALKNNPVVGAKILESPLVHKPMYLYLNIKHKKLIHKLVKAIRSSKSDGTHDRLQDQALKAYLTP